MRLSDLLVLDTDQRGIGLSSNEQTLRSEAAFCII